VCEAKLGVLFRLELATDWPNYRRTEAQDWAGAQQQRSQVQAAPPDGRHVRLVRCHYLGSTQQGQHNATHERDHWYVMFYRWKAETE